MSAVVIPNTVEQVLLDGLRGATVNAAADTMTLRLFKNDVTAGLTRAQIDALTAASFTQADFAGYAAAALPAGGWAVQAGDPSVLTHAQQSFTRSSTGTAQSIFGYYVTRDSDGALRWFEPFDAPVIIEFINDQLNITPTVELDDTEGNMLPPGLITPFGGTTAPSGWRLCDGTAISRTTFAGLFNVIGTAYGAGDGSTTFNVPDLRQRFPLGQATSGTGATMGATGGAIDHVHGLNTASSHAQITGSTTGGNSPRLNRKSTTTWTPTLEFTHNLQSAVGDATTGTALAGDSGTGNPPFQVTQYIIRL